MRDLCVTALSYLCVKQLQVCREFLGSFTFVHTVACFFTTWETVIQSADTGVLPSHTSASSRHFLQGRSTNSQTVSLHHRPHTDLSPSYRSSGFLLLAALTCFPLSVICMDPSHPQAPVINSIMCISLVNENKHKRCAVVFTTPAVVVRIFLRFSINHHSLCKLCAAQAAKLRGKFVPHPRPPSRYAMKIIFSTSIFRKLDLRPLS